ncbi:hypothetical protein PLICRDRAFT_43829 [Plicaturopsis crispa FD-325 SS-3]|nr:hypothetical protein PLICRDRAFT_43829 [Plicaturopsis crispa FD-325 SS-3]
MSSKAQLISDWKSKLPADDVARCISDARQDGIYGGLSSGLLSALIGQKFMKFGRYQTVFCGVLTGALSGYLFTQAFLESNLAKLQAQEMARIKALNQENVDL